jgi:hypothetical protein
MDFTPLGMAHLPAKPLGLRNPLDISIKVGARPFM